MIKVFTIIEHSDGIVSDISCELLTAARESGFESWAVIITNADANGLVKVVKKYGPDKIIVSENAVFDVERPKTCILAISVLIEKYQPRAIFMGHTSHGLSISPGLAVRHKLCLVSGCVGYDLVDDRLHFNRAIYGGRFLQAVESVVDGPVIGSFYPGAFTASEDSRKPEVIVEKVSIDIDAVNPEYRVKKMKEVVEDQEDIASAGIVVGVGKGVKKKQDMEELILPFAKVIGGTIGGSRVAVDLGLIPSSRQIGQSGKAIAPKIYIAIGISGAMQHIAGIKNSKVVISINKDKNAPIFKYSDYGIVEDLYSLMPTLLDEINKS